MIIHPIIQQQADDGGGQHSDDHLEPQFPGAFFLGRVLFRGERIELIEEQYQHRADGAQLDHHLEHFVKFGADLQFYKFIQQDQVASGGNGQPFGNALHNTEEDRF